MAAVLLVAPTAEAFTEPSGQLVGGGEETVLRLHDLPPGYRIGDDSGCGPLGPAEGGPEGHLERRYLNWLVRYWPEGCFYQYEQIFEVPSLGPAPPLVEAETLNTPSEAAAAGGFKLYSTLVNRSKEGRRRQTVSIPPSETRAILIRSKNELVEGKIGQPATYLFWRSGKLISFVEAAGMSPGRNDRAALHFAQIQQGRLEAPSPYTEAERDDTEVRLDDPALKFPVYWVGRSFEPGNGLPPASLEEVLAPWVGPPGEKVALWYEGFNLDAWTRTSWRRFAKSELGKVNLEARCTSREPFPLQRGSAEIFAGYDGRFHSCPKRRPDTYYAIAKLGGMVIGVNLGLCLSCRPGSSGPYASRRAIVAILRALVPRPKPAY